MSNFTVLVFYLIGILCGMALNSNKDFLVGVGISSSILIFIFIIITVFRNLI